MREEFPKILNIKFHLSGFDKWGMLNLYNWRDEISQIREKNQTVIKQKTINIHIPAFEHFFVKSYYSKNGFTFEELIQKIEDASIETSKYLVESKNQFIN
mgnify:CR=1 FL=1